MVPVQIFVYKVWFEHLIFNYFEYMNIVFKSIEHIPYLSSVFIILRDCQTVNFTDYSILHFLVVPVYSYPDSHLLFSLVITILAIQVSVK